MKKITERIGVETAFAGLFGLIAIIAVFFEMAIAGFDSASIAGGVKDIAGTIISVVMLIIAIRALAPKKKIAGGFEKRFSDEMDKVISKYSPLIQIDGSVKGRYNIADDMSVLYQNIDCKYHRMFDFDYKGELSFIVSKTLFMGKSKNDFTELQTIIINSITSKITREYDILNEKYKPIQDGFKLTFKQELLTPEDAVKVVEVIDKVILLYIVECKK
ncbi:MAG: hypothetical protein HDR09_10545 [Lachnospiraceae bacterium]|nr:hypothetical protein [Lachnospiraceae bacterium]